MFETYLTVVGRVITDVNVRVTQNGDKLCYFRVASNERRYNKDTQEWEDGSHLYVQVKCWRKLAENAAQSLARGDNVVLWGRLFVDEYEASGERRSMLVLDAKAIGPNLATSTVVLERPARGLEVGAESLDPVPVAA
ncbi:MAG: single-stranded DNA-binding protein [Labedaea sp.]